MYSSFSSHLAHEIITAYDSRYDHAKPANPELREAVALLRSWNGQMQKQTPAPLLVTLTYEQLERRIVEGRLVRANRCLPIRDGAGRGPEHYRFE